MKHETISPTIEVLLKARERVEADWCQGFGQGNKVCAVEALWRTGKFGSPRPIQDAIDLLARALPPPWRNLIGYNDHSAPPNPTTKADILALYDRAIELALKAQ